MWVERGEGKRYWYVGFRAWGDFKGLGFRFWGLGCKVRGLEIVAWDCVGQDVG